MISTRWARRVRDCADRQFSFAYRWGRRRPRPSRLGWAMTRVL